MHLDWTTREAWTVRSRWIGVLILFALFVFLVSRFLPALHEREHGFVAGHSDAFDGTVLDPGRRVSTSRHNRGSVSFYPHVRLADGRTVVLDTSVPETDIPAVGRPIAVRCLRDEPDRCRMDSRRGLYTNALGFGAIVLIWVFGMGVTAVRILRTPRHRPK